MCFGGRDKDEAGGARSREIDKVIRQDEKKMSKEVKLLLLGTYYPAARATTLITVFKFADFQFPTGAGESGKSTILKQMKLIYSQGFSKNEKLEWKPVVYNNIIQSFRDDTGCHDRAGHRVRGSGQRGKTR
jgi:guanine nucleotide-binding protein subunit alpha